MEPAKRKTTQQPQSKKRESWDAFKPGVTVEDKWYKEYGIGKVINRLKTVVYIQFPKEVLKYDRPHATQFLIIKE